MKLNRVFFSAVAAVFLTVRLLADDAKPTNVVATTPSVYVPDLSHAGGPLPDGVLAWNNILQGASADADQEQAQFTFYLTNVSSANVVVLDVHPSCGCTTAQLPPLPWTIPPGANGKIGVTVNLEGKTGTLFKSVDVSTDKGNKKLMLRIDMQPPVVRTLTDEEQMQGIKVAKVDRQAVFKGDCATCHAKNIEGKYGSELFYSVCGVCHEAPNRATMVPDLHNLKVPTNADFWRTWITHGKPGSLMPAFSSAEGGPLTDIQIASLAAYLNQAIPSHVVSPQ
jgi:mono/diheme cytochrome c family protein